MKKSFITAAAAAVLLLAAPSFAMAQSAPGSGTTTPPEVAVQAGYPQNEAEAKDYIERLGYSNVQNMKKDADGWHATAMRNDRQGVVDLDESGHFKEE